MRKIIYYSDPLRDEFSAAQIKAKPIDGSWRYIHTSRFKRFTHFFWYRAVATPLAWLYLKLRFRHRIVNRKLLKSVKGGYFLYGNHTQPVADAFVPTMAAFPRDVYVIVHPANVSMPFLGRVTPSMGALPLPDGLDAAKNFAAAVKTRAEEGHAVAIYPEAHIWPWYTGIRPFPDGSFAYPVRLEKPAYCFTNTYQRRWYGVKLVTYIDGPFTPDPALPLRERREKLRNDVFETMTRRSLESDFVKIEYRRREPESSD